MMRIENNYLHGDRRYLKISFPSKDELEKYRYFLINHGARDPIPRGIFFHNTDDCSYYSLLEPNWTPLQDWIQSLDRHTFWTKKTLQSNFLSVATPPQQPHYFSIKVRTVLEDVIHGLIKSHAGGLYSGLLTLPNIQDGKTGIFVSSDGNAAIIVCYNRIRERLPAWGIPPTPSTILLDPIDEFSRIKEDLLGFAALVDHLVQQFKDATTHIPMEIVMFKELYNYIPNFTTLPQIKRFETYVWRAPLFWPKSKLLRFCNFMFVVHHKEYTAAVDYSKLVNWQSLILGRVGIAQTDRLISIFNHSIGSATTYNMQIDKIIEFIRNAMHHLCRSGTYSFGHQEAIEIIHEQYPDWLPILYTSLVGGLGHQHAYSNKQPYRTFHELFEEEFDT